jgi:Fanconi anemia group J protein
MKESNVGKKAKVVHENLKEEQILEEDLKKNLQKKEKPKEKVPTIYFGTRTHSQVKQLVKELGTTSYRLNHQFSIHSIRPLMCVLGSRDHYCIHAKISKKPDKTNEW